MTELEESLATLRSYITTDGLGVVPPTDAARVALDRLREEITRLQIGNVDRSRLPVSTRTLIERAEAAERERDEIALERVTLADALDQREAEIARLHRMHEGARIVAETQIQAQSDQLVHFRDDMAVMRGIRAVQRAMGNGPVRTDTAYAEMFRRVLLAEDDDA